MPNRASISAVYNQISGKVGSEVKKNQGGSKNITLLTKAYPTESLDIIRALYIFDIY